MKKGYLVVFTDGINEPERYAFADGVEAYKLFASVLHREMLYCNMHEDKDNPKKLTDNCGSDFDKCLKEGHAELPTGDMDIVSCDVCENADFVLG